MSEPSLANSRDDSDAHTEKLYSRKWEGGTENDVRR